MRQTHIPLPPRGISNRPNIPILPILLETFASKSYSPFLYCSKLSLQDLTDLALIINQHSYKHPSSAFVLMRWSVITNFANISNTWQYDMIIPVWLTNHKIWPCTYMSTPNKGNKCVEQIVTEEEISVLKRRRMDKLRKALLWRGLKI